MKVTFVNRMMGIRRGGGEYFDLNMAGALCKLGVDVRFVVGRRYHQLDCPVDGFETHYIKSPYCRGFEYRYMRSHWHILRSLSCRVRFLDDRLFALAALRYIWNVEPDDIYQICSVSYLGYRLTKLGRKSVIRWPGPPSKNLADYAKHCAGTFAHGESYEHSKKFLPDTECIVAGCDTGLFKPSENKDHRKSECRFLFVGRCIPVKNLEFLIDGFFKARQAKTGITLSIVGDGESLPAIRAKVQGLKLDDSVEFTGFQEGQALAALYQKADCFTLVSHYESFGLVALEAMSSGLPLILSKAGNLPFFVEKYRAGSLVDTRDLQDLSNAMLWWADHPQQRKTVGLRNRKMVVENFSWQASAKKLIAFYEKLL